jgi:hypothetical protein
LISHDYFRNDSIFTISYILHELTILIVYQDLYLMTKLAEFSREHHLCDNKENVGSNFPISNPLNFYEKNGKKN